MRGLRFIAVLLTGTALVMLNAQCVPPKSLKQVSHAREGQVLNRRVAVVYSKHYQIDLGGLETLHSFDIRKYAKIYVQLVSDGWLRPADVFVPEPVTDEQIRLVHTAEFVESLKDSAIVARYLEAPIVKAVPNPLIDMGILNAFRYATGGTILASRLALENGIAINLGGGYHHAKPGRGEGFCIYADMPIAIRQLQKEGLIRRALIVDLDVHQGNGTAVCFRGDRDVFTFSMHQGNIYPIPKAHSDLDIELKPGTDDDEYMRLLRKFLSRVIRRSRPDIVFLQAGCDTLAGDPLAGLSMTAEGIARRDRYVIDACTARRIPVVMVLGGGYSDQAWQVQYSSICNILKKYGLSGAGPGPSRPLTTKEKLYVK